MVLLGPAPDRIPAVEAVAIIEPPETGFVGPVFCIAVDACLTARKTLWEIFNRQCLASVLIGQRFIFWLPSCYYLNVFIRSTSINCSGLISPSFGFMPTIPALAKNISNLP